MSGGGVVEDISVQGGEEVIPAEVMKEIELKGGLYKSKHPLKAIRVLTVLVYLLSVSLAAILLSTWYVLAWETPKINATHIKTHKKWWLGLIYRNKMRHVVSATIALLLQAVHLYICFNFNSV